MPKNKALLETKKTGKKRQRKSNYLSISAVPLLFDKSWGQPLSKNLKRCVLACVQTAAREGYCNTTAQGLADGRAVSFSLKIFPGLPSNKS